VPSLLPLHESEHPEELVILNFRGLGTGYRPVLLTFATLLLLAVLMLAPGGLVAKLPVSGSNHFNAASWTPSDPASGRENVRLSPQPLPLLRLPMIFEPNQGQADPRVKFLARGEGYGVFLTPHQAVLTLGARARSAVVRMQLAGANPDAAVSGSSQLPGKSNYFIGNNPASWHRNIPQYARVRYQGVHREHSGVPSDGKRRTG
jgi:hypothetical protein